MNNYNPLSKPFFDNDETEEITKVLDSGWVSQGPKVKEFEGGVAKHIGVKYAVAVSNCTAALHLANISIGILPGDEVLVADYTFPATGHSVLYCGATPVFVDIDPKTYNIDPTKIEENITDKTKAIIPVHTFGQSADMDKILKITHRYNLPVIEDAACALGATFKKKFAGTMGDIGCFSFHARKGITTGEGGMVVTNNKEIAEKIRCLSVFGMTTVHESSKENTFSIPKFSMLGYNYKMSDINAAIGIAQLKKLEKIILKKRKLAQYYNEKLNEIDGVEAPFESEKGTHIYQSYVSLIRNSIKRNKCIKLLLKRGIQTQIGTYASHIQPVYGDCMPCLKSLEVYNKALALPMYYSLEENNIDYICSNLEQVLKELK